MLTKLHHKLLNSKISVQTSGADWDKIVFLLFSLNMHSFYSLNYVSLITLSLNNEMLPTVSALWEILYNYVDIFRGSWGSKFRWTAPLDTCWCRSVSSHRGCQLTSKLVSRLAQSCWGQSMSLMQPTDWWEIKKSLSAYRAATLLLTPYIDSSQNVLCNACVCMHSVQFYWHCFSP